MRRKHLFLGLAVLGITYTWYYNIQYFQTAESPSLINFFKDAQSNFAGKSFGADLTVVVLTFFVFMIPSCWSSHHCTAAVLLQPQEQLWSCVRMSKNETMHYHRLQQQQKPPPSHARAFNC